MKIIGSQRRELLSETEYKLISLSSGEAILLNAETKHRELWQEKDDYAGYVVEIQGIGFEFVRELK